MGASGRINFDEDESTKIVSKVASRLEKLKFVTNALNLQPVLKEQ